MARSAVSQESLRLADSSRSSEEAGPEEFMAIRTNGPEASDAGTYRPQRRDSTAMIEESDVQELRMLATAISQRRRQSHATGSEAGNEDFDAADSAMDPSSKSFDLGVFLRRIIKDFRKEGFKERRLGISYKDLTVSGTGEALQLQSTVGTVLQMPLRLGESFSFGKKSHKTILHNFDGHVESGELLIVLGRPGSGCSTLLKTITGQLHGLKIGEQSTIDYNGIPMKHMIKVFKGEVLKNQEVDKHFPHLTVGQTLEFAAATRTPSKRIHAITREEHIKHAARIVMAICGLSHTYNTKVGNDFIRGVSGGERKRVSIAEMMLAGSPIAAWDNSTRGLDSATALKFVQSLRLAADFTHSVHCVAIYQASQAIYDLFDKAVVLYEGRQIYFGPAPAAKAYFETMGWFCPQRQTTGDFLTSVTNPQERVAREGMENKVPRTPEEFEAYWYQSPDCKALRNAMEKHEAIHPIDPHGQTAVNMRENKQQRQAKHVRPKSPYIISVAMQVRLTTKRAYQRILNDISATATQAVMQVVLALIIGSVFYGTPNATAGFYAKGSVIFQAILMNALTAISEINKLYAQRPIVEKHAAYAFYHPYTEALAGIMTDIPIKFITGTIFNLIVYFMSGLRREPAQFFLFFLITYTTTFVMSAIFRTLAAITKTVSQAMMLAGVMVLALVIYTGFVVTVPKMHPWFSWIRWINPVYYAFEVLIANEFHGRSFTCSSIIPAYTPLVGDSWICSVASSVAGQHTVSGDAFIGVHYKYYYAHAWRNFGILLAFLFAFMFVYFVSTELNSQTTSAAEVLVFQRGHVPAYLLNGGNKGAITEDMTKASPQQDGNEKTDAIEPQTDVFTWRDVVYDVTIKGQDRRLLNHVSGWVKPGTLTALMGVSGAGKTTLLDALAQRTTMGVITDLHLSTATVRESLRFSAMLRQPQSVSKEEKFTFVEEVIDMLDMRDFANAVVGVPGQGLNVEQRKLLTIGVELAAKPKLLLFLDEPTSGLDSQSSWAICAFLRKLADHGQAVLCTIHQPSAVLFQQFDRLLFLAAGGKTVYFGDIGENSRTLLEYFETHGAEKCGDEENPAEYMLNIVNRGSNSQGEDWHDVWNNSRERQDVMAEINRIHVDRAAQPLATHEDPHSRDEFAMPFGAQLARVATRVCQQYWRSPTYVFSKFILGTVAGLFIGFSFFGADGTLAGMQNRDLYEVRERPSKAYSWKAFMIANVIVEIPYQILTGILIYASFYYAVIGIQSSARQGLILLFCIQFMLYASSFAQMTIASMPVAETAASIVTLLLLFSLTFCGVLQTPSALPGFWIFMHRVSPFTYWVAGIVSTQLHGRAVDCSKSETSIFSPPAGMTCGEYMAPYLTQAPGNLQNPNDTENCRYCSLKVAVQYLAQSSIFYSQRWRNFGIMWAYIAFNIFIAVISYWAFRVKKWNRGGKSAKKTSEKNKTEKA
ncbi:ABC multidrug transporter [Grosmannia clavigera kw1407]|uniref:ABC multidrug transporter n=1 Tax=Grosmannia clavigera (strain kw1407 / UAMH 11150) TaxID=655863 RepID=F0XHF1_GROCL|nr:ABC multidrug transporter [Grosmannia clavigera kw1407]EFX03218.1 ABC multidrug transporter [Grosmannia clavigera kw1407]